MPAAAADAPTGNHQVFARKKYALMKVSSQMTTRRTRPMYPDLPVEQSGVTNDLAAKLRNPHLEAGKRGESTTGLSKRKRVLAVLISYGRCKCLGKQREFSLDRA